MIRDQNGRQANHFYLYPIFGLRPGQHLPPEGFGPYDFQGTQIKCEPANGGKHRIKYHCSACDKWVPFGRALQHQAGREHKLNYCS